MGDWLTIRERNLIPPLPTPDVAPVSGLIRLDDLAGPTETMEAAGFSNRGSLAYAMQSRGFPQPVKVLRGIRLWDITAVQAWRAAIED